ncbi:ImmA/IrrE family metallo-endopeptidase [Ligilactobacillus salivarius]|uniref:ImmA/IrrE family metallo-endopeptidase n=1 Tax=Ligilactobacillus salivarius TaxID=1624 RepID=UPI002150C32F|nr:ImmA/IrrE family metallo-endopeptidase [Ligilactobacillus salivarius]MDH4959820.1 ImmA/IrrE family metallo-endopeptidase [Ligilactobacillus salivarius]UUY24028.1 ImmA/IrrE family metallo-endopeptidase [Ligilactobacillus salivarius]
MLFNHRIDAFLRENEITVAILDGLDNEGFYIPEKRTIILKSELSKNEQIKVLLHELGHIFNDDKVIGSYNDYLVPRSKMESKANDFMLRELLENYILRTNTDPTDINCVSFLESEKLPMSFEDSVRRIIMSGLSF